MGSEKSFIENVDFNQKGLHPSKDIKSTLGNELLGKRIVLCITASVACYKAIDLIRTLIRHGAEVSVVISKAVERFITKEYLLWASGNQVISELSGDLEHVRLADYERSDIIIVYPCTANTIGKFANGIDDTPVTSVLSIGLGSRIPIIIAPAMHEAMYHNVVIKQNIQKLEKYGVSFMNPLIEEGKAKVASIESIYLQSVNLIKQYESKIHVPQIDQIQRTMRWFFCKCSIDIALQIKREELHAFLKDKKILISLGSTVEHIDPIRIVSNTSSGKMGFSLIKKAIDFGLDVTIVKGLTSIDSEFKKLDEVYDFKTITIKTTDQMAYMINKELSIKPYDIVILAAAVSDFKPLKYSYGKISTDQDRINLTLIPATKIIDRIKDICKKTFLVGFKADYCVPEDILLVKSYKKLIEANADLIVANDVGTEGANIGSDANKILILNKDKNYYDFPIQSKDDVAEYIFKLIYLNMKKDTI